MSFMNWLKWKVAGDELEELYTLRTRVIKIIDWIQEFEDIRVAAKYLLDPVQGCDKLIDVTYLRQYLRCDKTNREVETELTFAEVFPEIINQAVCPMQRLSMYENRGVIVATVPQMISLLRHALVSDYVKDMNCGCDLNGNHFLFCKLTIPPTKYKWCKFKIIKG